MVDFEAYYQHASTNAPLGSLEPSIRESECGCSTCQKNDILRRTLKFDYDNVEASVPLDKWEEDQLLICPPRVMAYSMRHSHWAQLQVDLVKTASVDPNADTFDHKLSLNKDTKMIIKNLVVNHEKGKKRDGKGLDDLVEDKGKGLVLLFHGMLIRFNMRRSMTDEASRTSWCGEDVNSRKRCKVDWEAIVLNWRL